jgi:hypothetical protein
MERLRRIVTGACACAALSALLASSAFAAKPSLLLVAHTSKKAVAVGTELVMGLSVTDKVTTKLGSTDCLSPTLTGHVTANGGASIQVELTRPASQNTCLEHGAMPFTKSQYLWGWGNFPFNHSFGKLVLKPKGKVQNEGIAELFPSPETNDLMTFSATEAELTRECSYSFKKLKGAWFVGTPTQIALNKGDKMKSDGSENEASCPKSATIPIGLNLREETSSGREVVEVLPV